MDSGPMMYNNVSPCACDSMLSLDVFVTLSKQALSWFKN